MEEKCIVCGSEPKSETLADNPFLYRVYCPDHGCAMMHHYMFNYVTGSSKDDAWENWNDKNWKAQ